MGQKEVKNKELLVRGVEEIIVKKNLERRLASGQKLRVKFGIDPTSSKMHIGHMVNVKKLREFQDLGYQIIFIIGDYTARIGDPSGKDRTRPPLSTQEIENNAKKYFDQAYKILDKKKTEVHLQSEWYKKLGLEFVIKLMSQATMAQIMAHETFRLRLKQKSPLSMHEVFYPLLQAYDSVAIKADVEVGAVDQKFNLLMGREIQPKYQQKPQDVVIMKYLIGLDGKEKMGKTTNNYISILDKPIDMYGKVMSITDEQIIPYFELATNTTMAEIEGIKKELSAGANPRDYKAQLAREVVSIYHTKKAAQEAEEEFNRIFQSKKLPSKIPIVKVKSKKYPICEFLVYVKLTSSKSEARRLVEQKAVQIDEKIVKNWQEKINPKRGMVIKVGKRKFIKLEII